MSVIQDLLVNKSFLALDRQLNAWNMFRVLKLAEYEIRHTTFLAHLLNPCETHGLGNTFLRNFLLEVGTQLPPGDGNPLDRIHELNLDMTRVMAELTLKNQQLVESDEQPANKQSRQANEGRLDILLQIPRRDGPDLAVLIEAKVNARQGDGQLNRYRDWIQRTAFINPVMLYLTLSEDEALSEPWHNITYSNAVYPALENTLDSAAATGKTSCLMISHYMAILRDKAESEAAYADADTLAQEIHREFPDAKAAIDQLLQVRSAPLEEAKLDAAWGLYNRHKAAFEFLAKYHKDELAKVLEWFSDDWPAQVAGINEAARVVVDDSNRSYLRFLLLPHEGRLNDFAHTYARRKDDGRFVWTRGQHALLFEIRCSPEAAASATGTPADRFNWNLYLVVGPLQNVDRDRFVGELRTHLTALENSRGKAGLRVAVSKKRITRTYTSVLKVPLGVLSRIQLQESLSSKKLVDLLLEVARAAEKTFVVVTGPLHAESTSGTASPVS